VIRFAVYSILAICCGAAVFAMWLSQPEPYQPPTADETRMAKLRATQAKLQPFFDWSATVDAYGDDSIEAMEALNAACLPEPPEPLRGEQVKVDTRIPGYILHPERKE